MAQNIPRLAAQHGANLVDGCPADQFAIAKLLDGAFAQYLVFAQLVGGESTAAKSGEDIYGVLNHQITS